MRTFSSRHPKKLLNDILNATLTEKGHSLHATENSNKEQKAHILRANNNAFPRNASSAQLKTNVIALDELGCRQNHRILKRLLKNCTKVKTDVEIRRLLQQWRSEGCWSDMSPFSASLSHVVDVTALPMTVGSSACEKLQVRVLLCVLPEKRSRIARVCG